MPAAAPLTLLVPDKPDRERDAVAAAWTRARGPIVRLGRFWDPPALSAGDLCVYGHDTFCLVLAEKLGLTLVSPDDLLLVAAPPSLLHRALRVVHVEEATGLSFPTFVKPVTPKQFPASVYASAAALGATTEGLAADAALFVSEVVTFVAEARAFVLEGRVLTCAVYEGHASSAEAGAFAQHVAAAMNVPKTCVVDVGQLIDGRWALIEFNATWGAGLNGCDAERVVECLVAACFAG